MLRRGGWPNLILVAKLSMLIYEKGKSEDEGCIFTPSPQSAADNLPSKPSKHWMWQRRDAALDESCSQEGDRAQ